MIGVKEAFSKLLIDPRVDPFNAAQKLSSSAFSDRNKLSLVRAHTLRDRAIEAAYRVVTDGYLPATVDKMVSGLDHPDSVISRAIDSRTSSLEVSLLTAAILLEGFADRRVLYLAGKLTADPYHMKKTIRIPEHSKFRGHRKLKELWLVTRFGRNSLSNLELSIKVSGDRSNVMSLTDGFEDTVDDNFGAVKLIPTCRLLRAAGLPPSTNYEREQTHFGLIPNQGELSTADRLLVEGLLNDQEGNLAFQCYIIHQSP